MKKPLTLKQAAMYLSMHPEVLRRKAAANEIPAQKLGRGKRSPWRFQRKKLDEWLDREKRNDSMEISTDASIQRMLHILKTTDDIDKQADAINSLGLLGVEEAVEDLKPFLDSPFQTLRQLACRAIIQILGSESKPLVYHFLKKHSDPSVKLEVAGFFAIHGSDRESIEWLQKKMDSTKDPDLKRKIAYSLFPIYPEKFLPFIRKELDSNHSALRYKALTALKTIPYKKWESDLRKMVMDKSPAIRKKSIQYIGLTRNRNFIDMLQAILNSHESDNIKKEAALAIARFFESNTEKGVTN